MEQFLRKSTGELLSRKDAYTYKNGQGLLLTLDANQVIKIKNNLSREDVSNTTYVRADFDPTIDYGRGTNPKGIPLEKVDSVSHSNYTHGMVYRELKYSDYYVGEVYFKKDGSEVEIAEVNGSIYRATNGSTGELNTLIVAKNPLVYLEKEDLPEVDGIFVFKGISSFLPIIVKPDISLYTTMRKDLVEGNIYGDRKYTSSMSKSEILSYTENEILLTNEDIASPEMYELPVPKDVKTMYWSNTEHPYLTTTDTGFPISSNTVFEDGKYIGRSILDVFDKDPKYIKSLVEMRGIESVCDIKELSKELIDKYSSTPHWIRGIVIGKYKAHTISPKDLSSIQEVKLTGLQKLRWERGLPISNEPIKSFMLREYILVNEDGTKTLVSGKKRFEYKPIIVGFTV